MKVKSYLRHILKYLARLVYFRSLVTRAFCGLISVIVYFTHFDKFSS